ncbi:MAG: glycosyltransferase family 8 protein [Oscillospiraceae bacterium]|nr:glycosyltransferase family 8 protein [Oscillospiraceae bacterium]
MKNIIPVVFAANDNYVPYLGVALTSLIANISDENMYMIYVLTTDISDVHMKKISAMGKSDVKIEFIDVSDLMSGRKIGTVKHLSPETAYRLLIEKIFKDYEKILYLDCDIVINRDVAELYNTDIGDNLLGAARGMVFEPEYIADELKLNRDNYFNAGILVMNVKKFAQENIGEKGLEMLSQKNYNSQDQDVLNILCQDRVKYLDSHWNIEWQYITGMVKKFYITEYIEKIITYRDDPYIVHYTSHIKPWINPGFLLADYFWKYAKKSDFYDEITERYRAKKEYDFKFPEEKVNKNDKIILYGYGIAGYSYFEQIIREELCELAAVCEKNTEKFRYTSLCVPIIGINEINNYDFDYIVISVRKKEIVDEIVKDLEAENISRDKIIWVN